MDKKILYLIIAIVAVVVVCLGGYFFLGDNNSSLDNTDNNSNNQDNLVADSDVNDNSNTDVSVDGNVLVVYFSAQGHTEEVAGKIAQNLGGDVFSIEPSNPYTSDDLDWTDSNSRVSREHEDESLRDMELEVSTPDNWESYDTVLIGYPIWWYQMPMIMYTFFDEYDFDGKTIVHFNTHEGSGDSGTYDEIQELEPNATVLDGLAIRGGDMESDQTETVRSWLEDLGFNE